MDTEKDIEQVIGCITHPAKKQWYIEAYALLRDTWGYPFEPLNKQFVDGFIDGYVHAKSLSNN